MITLPKIPKYNGKPEDEIRFVQIVVKEEIGTDRQSIYGLTREGVVYYYDVAVQSWAKMSMKKA